MSRSLRVALDCDGVLSDLPSYYLEWLRRNYDGVRRTPEELVNRKWHTGIGIPGHIDELFFTEVPFKHHVSQITNYKGARDFVDALKKQGHNVICLTATASAAWTGQRAEWLERVIGLSCKKHVIVGKEEKEYHSADVFVDDDTSNIRNWAGRNPLGLALIFDRPWNSPRNLSAADLEFPSNVLRVFEYGDILSTTQRLSEGQSVNL